MTRKNKPKKIQKKTLRKTTKDTEKIKDLAKKKKIVFAETARVEYLRLFVDEVLDAIKEVCGIDPAFVSDESAVWDFTRGDEDEARKIGVALEVSVSEDDYIVDVAQRIKDDRG